MDCLEEPNNIQIDPLEDLISLILSESQKIFIELIPGEELLRKNNKLQEFIRNSINDYSGSLNKDLESKKNEIESLTKINNELSSQLTEELKINKALEPVLNQEEKIEKNNKVETFKELIKEISEMRKALEKQNIEYIKLQEESKKNIDSEGNKSSIENNLNKIKELEAEIKLYQEKESEKSEYLNKIHDKQQEIDNFLGIKKLLEQELTDEEIMYEHALEEQKKSEKSNTELLAENESLSNTIKDLKKALLVKNQEVENITKNSTIKYNELYSAYTIQIEKNKKESINYESLYNEYQHLCILNKNLEINFQAKTQELHLLRKESDINAKTLVEIDDSYKDKLKQVNDTIKIIPVIYQKILKSSVYERNLAISYMNNAIWICNQCGSMNHFKDKDCCNCVAIYNLANEAEFQIFNQD